MNKFVELRQKAEVILKKQPISTDDSALHDIQSALHELNVRQVELELQNEELTAQNAALRLAHNLLEISQKKYVDLYDFAPVGYCTLDQDGWVVEANLTVAQQVGVARSALLNTRFYDNLAAEDRDTFFLHLRQLSVGQERHTCEVRIVNADGSQIYAFLDSRLVTDAENDSALCRTTITDITSRKEVEVVKELLNEKNVLLKELYHRTKNNMQVIISLLALQSRDIEDEETRKVFRDSENRIRSMALVHQKLYETKDMARINLGTYILDMVELLRHSYIGVSQVTLSPDLDDVFVTIETAIPCGLVINELLTNCFKHAFSAEQGGTIRLGLHRLAGHDVELLITDDGAGMPPGIDIKNTQTLGLKLINSVVTGQLRGTAIVDTSQGVAWTIRFPLP